MGVRNEERQAGLMLLRLADLLTGFHQNFDSVRRIHDAKPALGSQVEIELAQESAIATEELRRPLLDCFGLATIMMVAATDHFFVLGNSVKPPPRPFAPQTLARQGIELAARAFHLMEPGIEPLDRAGLYVTEMLYSHWETKSQGVAMADGSRPEDKERQMLAWAEKVGLSVHKTKRDRLWVGNSDRPGSTQAVKNMMKKDIGGGGYHMLSSASHGVVGGLADRLEPEEGVPGEDDVATVSVSLWDITLLASWVIMGCLPAFERYFQAHGWDDQNTQAWRYHALKTAREIAEKVGVFRPRDDKHD